MSENEDTAYERLVQEIYQAIHDQEAVATVDVEHNKTIQGKSGCSHQLDVYWEFNVAGVLHRVAIECKNWNSDVPIGRIRDFFGVLHDIGNIKGIFVTKIGYQSGAKQFAEFYGIDLKEARIPTHTDWEGRVKDIVLHFTSISTRVKNRDIDLDQDWIRRNTEFATGEQLRLAGQNNEIFLYDSHGEKLTSMYDLEQKLPHSWERAEDMVHTYHFDDAYLYPSGTPIKINSVRYTYDVETYEQETVSEGDEIVRAILRDVNSGELKALRQDGGVN